VLSMYSYGHEPRAGFTMVFTDRPEDSLAL
jgi:hypothetical protein